MTANTTTVLPDARALVADMIRDHFHGAIIREQWSENGHAQTEDHDACTEVDALAAEIVTALSATQSAPDAAVPAGEGIEEAAENWLDQRVAPEHSRDRDYGADDMVDAFIAGAAAPKVASEAAGVDVEEQARGLLRQQVGDGEKGVSITWGGNPSIDAHAALAAIRAALATDATDGATGGEVQ